MELDRAAAPTRSREMTFANQSPRARRTEKANFSSRLMEDDKGTLC